MTPIYMKNAWRNLKGYKARTWMIVFSISICLILIGTLLNTNLHFQKALLHTNEETNKADITFYTNSFTKEVVSELQELKGIQEAEAKFESRARLEVDGQLRNVELTRLPAEGNYRIQKFETKEDTFQKGVYIEKSSAEYYNLTAGEKVNLQLPGRKSTELVVKGVISDYDQIPSEFSGQGYVYVTPETFESLGGQNANNIVQVTVDGARQIDQATSDITQKLENEEINVSRTVLTSETENIRELIVHSVLLLLVILGSLACLLGIILVGHLFYRMILEKMSEMSVFKSLGATSIYFIKQLGMTVFMIGTFTALISIPVSYSAAHLFSTSLTNRLHLVNVPFYFQMEVGAIILGAAYVVPALAMIFPLIRVLMLPVARGLQRIPVASTLKKKQGKSHFFHYETLIFRQAMTKKVQWVTNLLMLSFGGAVIIACTALYSSLVATVDHIQKFSNYDVEWTLSGQIPNDHLLTLAKKIEGSKDAEGWTVRNTEVYQGNDRTTRNSQLVALPKETTFFQPNMLQGIWSFQKDEVVINQDMKDLLGENLNKGDKIRLKTGGKEKEWKISGVISGQLEGPAVYLDLDAYHKWMETNTVNRLAVQAENPNKQGIQKVIDAGEKRFEANNIAVQSVESEEERQNRPEAIIQTIIFALVVVGFLFIIVGAVNLMTAMSANVFERRNDLGIIRSMGGSKLRVYQLFIGEGLLVAVLSSACSILLSYPLHLYLARQLGQTLLNSSLIHVYPLSGAGFWLIISVFIGIAASYLPARKAANQPVRELIERS
ncbi:ABC transporter permease [Metabacillus arenae]|uniref:ABC transporter permease n=1 Tax=Metabacillus arenae TaxID=2771434 RepID=A0A926NM28_9BACI|nr:FtsX-like permease family protein [Metabacillus arenae]MBD1382448.1 ABC transporter permease [Metabacillus arenae]